MNTLNNTIEYLETSMCIRKEMTRLITENNSCTEISKKKIIKKIYTRTNNSIDKKNKSIETNEELLSYTNKKKKLQNLSIWNSQDIIKNMRTFITSSSTKKSGINKQPICPNLYKSYDKSKEKKYCSIDIEKINITKNEDNLPDKSKFNKNRNQKKLKNISGNLTLNLKLINNIKINLKKRDSNSFENLKKFKSNNSKEALKSITKCNDDNKNKDLNNHEDLNMDTIHVSTEPNISNKPNNKKYIQKLSLKSQNQSQTNSYTNTPKYLVSKFKNIFGSNKLSIIKSEKYTLSENLHNIPMDKEEILKIYSNLLKSDEINEIKEIKHIYFLGLAKLKSNQFQNEQNFQNKKGNYLITVGDHIYYRYEIISELGSGSFGQAIKCFDHKLKEFVCVKIIKNKKKFNIQAKLEIGILEYIKANDTKVKCPSNIVKIKESFTFRNHICIVFELLDINLYEFLKMRDFIGLDLNNIRKISIQLLNSLIFLQKYKIIHCDLKPENILLRKCTTTGIKLIDFGSSCYTNEKLYMYIQSRFYRAPEIILGNDYGTEIDMWSFGCVISELFTGLPIFPGENEKDQIAYIIEYLGLPPYHMIQASAKAKQWFEESFTPIFYTNSKGKVRQPNSKKISNFLKGSDKNFIDLISKCLEWSPQKRIKPDEAILHPWIKVGLNKESISLHQMNLRSRMKSGKSESTIDNSKIEEINRNKVIKDFKIIKSTDANKTESNLNVNPI